MRIIMMTVTIVLFTTFSISASEWKIFCHGELEHDYDREGNFVRDSARIPRIMREVVLPEGGLFNQIGNIGDMIAKIIPSEYEHLIFLDHHIPGAGPGLTPPLLVQISEEKGTDGMHHVESICVLIQDRRADGYMDPAPALSKGSPGHGSPMDLNSLINFPHLKHLELYAFNIDETVVFSEVSNLKELEYLGLPVNTDDEHLKHISGLKKLKFVNASATRVNGQGLSILSKLPQLKTLDLRHTHVSVKALAALTNSMTLETLLLSDTPLYDICLKSIGKIPNLQYLTLNHTRITDVGLQSLHQAVNLKYLSLYDTSTTERGRSKLVQQIPGLKIDIHSPLHAEDFFFAKQCVLAHLENKMAQNEVANYYARFYDNKLHVRRDLVESLKWRYIIRENPHGKGIKINVDKIEYEIQEVEKELSPQEIEEAKRRARVYQTLFKQNEINFELKREKGIPTYQYGFHWMN